MSFEMPSYMLCLHNVDNRLAICTILWHLIQILYKYSVWKRNARKKGRKGKKEWNGIIYNYIVKVCIKRISKHWIESRRKTPNIKACGLWIFFFYSPIHSLNSIKYNFNFQVKTLCVHISRFLFSYCGRCVHTKGNNPMKYAEKKYRRNYS